MKYYVVFKGHNPGVYDNWDEVNEQTKGFPGALLKASQLLKKLPLPLGIIPELKTETSSIN